MLHHFNAEVKFFDEQLCLIGLILQEVEDSHVRSDFLEFDRVDPFHRS